MKQAVLAFYFVCSVEYMGSGSEGRNDCSCCGWFWSVFICCEKL